MIRWKSMVFTFCSLLTAVPTDMRSSRVTCDNLGMQQVVIKDTATYEEVKDYLRHQDSKRNIEKDVWVGIYWDSYHNTFRWLNNDAKVENISWENIDGPDCMWPCSNCKCKNNHYHNCVRLVRQTYVFDTSNCYKQLYSLCQPNSTVQPIVSGHATTNQNEPCELCSTNDRTTNKQVTCEPCPTCEVTINQHVTREPCPTCDVTTNQKSCPTNTTTKTPNQSTAAVQSFDQTAFQDSLYKVKKNETGSYRRRRTSANDDRFSSKVIGLTGVTILVIVCCVFPAVDMMNVFTKTDKKQKRNNRK